MSNFWEKEIINLLTINPGYSIQYIAEKMFEQAQDENRMVSGVFRGIKLTAAPNMKSPKDVINQYERKLANKPIVGKCPFFPAMILGNGAVGSLRDNVRDYVTQDEVNFENAVSASNFAKRIAATSTFISLTADKLSDSGIVCAAFDRKNSTCVAKNTLAYGVCEELRKELYKNNICRNLLAR